MCVCIYIYTHTYMYISINLDKSLSLVKYIMYLKTLRYHVVEKLCIFFHLSTSKTYLTKEY